MAKFAAPTETKESCLTDYKLNSSLPIISRLVADTGATSHFLESSASYTNKLVAHPGISVLLPNHGVMKSTHTAQLSLPFLPPEACKAHIFPCLASGSLISIGQRVHGYFHSNNGGGQSWRESSLLRNKVACHAKLVVLGYCTTQSGPCHTHQRRQWNHFQQRCQYNDSHGHL